VTLLSFKSQCFYPFCPENTTWLIDPFPLQSACIPLFVNNKDVAAEAADFTDWWQGNIVIATPGRLEDMFRRKSEGLELASAVRSLDVLVLDEADRLLDMGFETSLNTILGYLPKQRRTGLFSATQTQELEKLVRAGLRNPVRITVKEKGQAAAAAQKTPSRLSNYYTILRAEDKFNNLVTFLRQHKHEKNLVFFSGIMVCTDVMARGIDIPDVNWVLQYDPPSSARSKMSPIKDVVDVLPKVKAMALADRAMFDKGMRAFVSFVQAYAKHECSLIFRVKDLDFVSMARGFALLRLPKMPELRGKSFPDFTETTVDTDSIRYKDKNREKQRQKMLAELKDKVKVELPKKNFIKNKAWSKQKSKKERRKKRAAKRKHDEVILFGD
ncbi:hypothetical protein GOODEAATRI_021199, partial [Goodea atripinnis]